jgi:CRP/FNR family transcriptional regulator, anaerobic regulatory protein
LALQQTPSNFIQKLVAFFQTDGMQKTLSKGDFLIREGEVEKHIYWIESGAVRAFYLTEFEEQIIRLGYKDNMITSLSSFLTGRNSELYIEAIRKTTVKTLHKDQLDKLVHESHENLLHYKNFLETLLSQQIDRELDLLITSPQQRLQRVLERSPNLVQEIPMKYIASYLRMSAETLSRIRNS